MNLNVVGYWPNQYNRCPSCGYCPCCGRGNYQQYPSFMSAGQASQHSAGLQVSAQQMQGLDQAVNSAANTINLL